MATLHPSDNAPGQYEIHSLPIGGRFRVVTPYRSITGTVVDVRAGSVMVRLDGQSHKVKIHNSSTGTDAEFDSTRSKSVYWARETPVEFLNEIVEDSISNVISNPEEDDNMGTAAVTRKSRTSTKKSVAPAKKSVAAAKAVKSAKSTTAGPALVPTPAPAAVTAPAADSITRALQARWKMAVMKLGELLKVDGPSNLAQAQRDRIRSIYDEAIAAQVLLTASVVTYTDPVFTEMELGEFSDAVPSTDAAAGAVTASDAPTPKDGTSPLKGKAARKADRQAKKAAAGAKATRKVPTPRSTKPVELHPCLEGCGHMVKGNFKQGHDAKYRSLILQVERGEIKSSVLPAHMAKHGGKDGEPLKFKQVSDGLKCTNSVLNH